MSPDRRSFTRESEGYRREALVGATLDLVAEGGAKAATVRAIADRAGVTPGLIRHYFAGKDELMRAAYRAHMDGMTRRAVERAGAPGLDPVARLAAFVVATLSAPVATAPSLRRWAGLLHEAVADEALREVHRDGYLDFRAALERLIADLPGRPAGAGLRTYMRGQVGQQFAALQHGQPAQSQVDLVQVLRDDVGVLDLHATSPVPTRRSTVWRNDTHSVRKCSSAARPDKVRA